MKTPEQQAEEYIKNCGFTENDFPITRRMYSSFLAGYKAAQAWHSIESAPKDGTEFRGGYRRKSYIDPSFWFESIYHWKKEQGFFYDRARGKRYETI